MSIQNHPALIQAYTEYMDVRYQVRRGLLGSGSIPVYRDRLRAVYCVLADKPFKESWQIALTH